jgi:hypothetical protein
VSLRSFESQFHRFHFSRTLIVEFKRSLRRAKTENEKLTDNFFIAIRATQHEILIESNCYGVFLVKFALKQSREWTVRQKHFKCSHVNTKFQW